MKTCEDCELDVDAIFPCPCCQRNICDECRLKHTQKTLQNLEQSTAFLADNFPPMWRRIYDNLKLVGFNELQAMELLKTYILASCSVKIQP